MVKSQDGKEGKLKEIGYYTTSNYDSFYHFFYKKFYLENQKIYKKDCIIQSEYDKITITCDETDLSESKYFIYETEMLFCTCFGCKIHFTMEEALFDILKEKDFENIENRNDFLSEELIWKKLRQ